MPRYVLLSHQKGEGRENLEAMLRELGVTVIQDTLPRPRLAQVSSTRKSLARKKGGEGTR